jgi:hypothetical protein
LEPGLTFRLAVLSAVGSEGLTDALGSVEAGDDCCAAF